MTETGLLVAQVVFLVLMFAFLASVVRSSARQLGRVQPPPAPAQGPVVDPPRRVEATPIAAAPVAPVAAPPVVPPAVEPEPDPFAHEPRQNTLEPFPSPFATPAPESVGDLAAAGAAGAGALAPSGEGDDLGTPEAAEGADAPAPADQTAAEEETPFDILAAPTQATGAPLMDLTAGITPRLVVESSPSRSAVTSSWRAA